MALTKLNYNARKFASRQPVTLRFADAVGEMLTAGPFREKATLHSNSIFSHFVKHQSATSLWLKR
jgi:hypothetical protein